jgi:hypothetical protein
MKPINDLFTEIAREHLGIETLRTRNSDSLDFHDVSFRGVERALSAAYQAGVNDRTGNPAPDPVALREVREALERAEFLMRRVHEGDHRALGNLGSGSRQANRALAGFKASLARTPAAVLPIVAVTVRGGLIEDMDATMPVHAVVEDWDITDDDTGKKPARNVWKLDATLPAPKAEKLRRLIAND